MNKYSDDKNVQILIALLKARGIKKIITSPGATNISFVGSCQNDSWFEMYSCIDERAAAYMACGLAQECGEPVVITCTGATASRNYFPGLTEAYYKKIPILAVTFFVGYEGIGNLLPQTIDRSISPNDVIKHKLELRAIKDESDFKSAELKMNIAILELYRNGGGPVHINLAANGKNLSVNSLPPVRIIDRIKYNDPFPEIPNNKNKIAIYICSHISMNNELQSSIDLFCEQNNAVVFCDHSSGYRGKYRLMNALVATQEYYTSNNFDIDLLIHIGELSGDYYTFWNLMKVKEVWRISIDGEVRDTFKTLRYIFEINEIDFFKFYSKSGSKKTNTYLNSCKDEHKRLFNKIPDLPFSNLWIAQNMSPKLPKNCFVHFGVSNTMRSWTFFDVHNSIKTSANVGVRGIDGAVSTLIGSSLANPNKIHFGIMGDLTFFYDMNSLGNRHLNNNIRILLINNKKGVEFRLYTHQGQKLLGDDADSFVAAAGHYESKSSNLVKNYSESLGFKYFSAKNKEEFLQNYNDFISPKITNQPIFFEVFTDHNDEDTALRMIRNLENTIDSKAKRIARVVLGDKGVKIVKGILKK